MLHIENIFNHFERLFFQTLAGNVETNNKFKVQPPSLIIIIKQKVVVLLFSSSSPPPPFALDSC